MGQATALSNAHFTKSRLYCTLNGGSRCRQESGDWLKHN